MADFVDKPPTRPGVTLASLAKAIKRLPPDQLDELRKALGVDAESQRKRITKAMQIKMLAEQARRTEVLRENDIIKAMPAPGGPAVSVVTPAPARDAQLGETAEDLLEKALTVTDPVLSAGYRRKAAEARACGNTRAARPEPGLTLMQYVDQTIRADFGLPEPPRSRR